MTLNGSPNGATATARNGWGEAWRSPANPPSRGRADSASGRSSGLGVYREPRLPASDATQWQNGGFRLPLQRRGRPGIAPEFPFHGQVVVVQRLVRPDGCEKRLLRSLAWSHTCGRASQRDGSIGVLGGGVKRQFDREGESGVGREFEGRGRRPPMWALGHGF